MLRPRSKLPKLWPGRVRSVSCAWTFAWDLSHVLPSSCLAGGEIFSCQVNGWMLLLINMSSSCLVA